MVSSTQLTVPNLRTPTVTLVAASAGCAESERCNGGNQEC